MKGGNSIIAFDVDNTLFNWIDSIVPAIRNMVEVATEITDLPFEEITESLRLENKKRHSVEHPYALADTAIMREFFKGAPFKERKDKLRPAFEAFNAVREAKLVPYPHVPEFLDALSGGVGLVAYTESGVIGASYRLQKMDLERYFQKVYCGDIGVDQEERVRFKRAFSYLDPMKYTLLDPALRKPSPLVLARIQNELGANMSHYVGDSLFKDVGMAKEAGVRAAWAKYGISHDSENADYLIKISHWSDSEIEQFKAQSYMSPPTPDVVLKNNITELLSELAGTRY